MGRLGDSDTRSALMQIASPLLPKRAKRLVYLSSLTVFLGQYEHALLEPNIKNAAVCDRPGMATDGVLYIPILPSPLSSLMKSFSKFGINLNGHLKTLLLFVCLTSSTTCSAKHVFRGLVPVRVSRFKRSQFFFLLTSSTKLIAYEMCVNGYG